MEKGKQHKFSKSTNYCHKCWSLSFLGEGATISAAPRIVFRIAGKRKEDEFWNLKAHIKPKLLASRSNPISTSRVRRNADFLFLTAAASSNCTAPLNCATPEKVSLTWQANPPQSLTWSKSFYTYTYFTSVVRLWFSFLEVYTSELSHELSPVM